MAVGGWHPWMALRARAYLRLEWAEFTSGHRGCIEDIGHGWRKITLDAHLTRRERSAVLAHELIHDERGLLYTDATPAGLVRMEERIVEDETARRLVPLDDLDEWVRARVRSDLTVEWWDISDRYDVPRDVAERASRLLEQRTRRRHPSG